MVYSCSSCNYTTNVQQSYNRHIKSATHNKKCNNTRTNYVCENCQKIYLHRQSLYNHYKKCQSSNTNNQSVLECMQQKIDKFEKERDEMKAQIALLMEKCENRMPQGQPHNTTNSHNTNSHNNVIVVNNFGNENIDYITDKKVKEIITESGFIGSIPKLIDDIHFDKGHPENHNIKITNMKSNLAKIFKNDKWIAASKSDTIEGLLEKIVTILIDKYENTKKEIKPSKQQRFEDVQALFATQDKYTLKNINNKVDATLINGSNEIYKK